MTTINTQALQKAQATPLEQARVYLYENLRILERNAKPKGVAAQVRIAIDGFVRQSEQTRRDLVDELEASRHHAKGLKSHNEELLDYRNVLRNAFDNQQTLTHNALVESRAMADARYELEAQVRELKQQAGDAPAAQDIIDRLRKHIEKLDGQLYVQDLAIIRNAEAIVAKDKRIQEIIIDVNNAEGYSEKLALEVERQKEAVQRLLEVNGQLREAAGIAGDHVRAHNEATGVMYDTLIDAQAQLTEYLIGNVGERETLGRLLGILDNGIITEAMRFFDASPGDENCEICGTLSPKDA